MGIVQELFEKELSKQAKPQEALKALRRFQFSSSELERTEHIQLLSKLQGYDADRELIHLFKECLWRSTKLEIIKALSQHSTQRGLEFLFQLATDFEDIALSEFSIWSLGQTKHQLAARFLTQLYFTCPETLKPAVAGAIGQLPDRSLLQTFVKDLELSLEKGQHALSKNLILTLGELKAREALPVFQKLVEERSHPYLYLSALVSFGKTARDPSAFMAVESKYSTDLYEHQVFSNAVAQIRIRSQWSVEDYLQRIFSDKQAHATLPMELNHFLAEDVFEGLKLFTNTQSLSKLLFALKGLSFPQLEKFYLELVPWKQLSAEQLIEALQSVSAHLSKDVLAPVREVLQAGWSGNLKILDAAMSAQSLTASKPVDEFEKMLKDGFFDSLDEAGQVVYMNQLANTGMAMPNRTDAHQRLAKIGHELWSKQSSEIIRGRILRVFAQLKIRDDKIVKDLEPLFFQKKLLPSALALFESCPSKRAHALLFDAKSSSWLASDHPTLFLKAVIRQKEGPSPHSNVHIEKLIKQGLSKTANAELRALVLELVSLFPNEKLSADIVELLKSEADATAAVVALKALKKESFADVLAPLLKHGNPSVSGRSLDALCSLPGMRAKRVVIDFLKSHYKDVEVVDKITRALAVPETGHEYFISILDEVLNQNPEHPKKDALVDYRERILLAAKPGDTSQSSGSITHADLSLIDAALSKRLKNFPLFDESVKAALRSAELPFLHTKIFEGSVDKAFSVLEFCKALDLFFEKHLGRHMLFPRLEQRLHEFQNLVHGAHLNEDFPNAERVMKSLDLSADFSPQSFPLHKMQSLSKAILNGRILQDKFKTLDGLRAWAVVLLLFCRKTQASAKPLLQFKGIADAELVQIAKKLMALQDVRNPAAHRQTFLEFPGVDAVREECFKLLSQIEAQL